MKRELFDISLPVHNGMWSYREEWKNTVSVFESTLTGGQSTVYNLNLFSHTGTYIETSQHKLVNDLLLNDCPMETFYRNVHVIVVNDEKCITKNAVQEEIRKCGLAPEPGDALIIANGYGLQHNKEGYLKDSPYFEEELTNWLCSIQLGLLGVDTPIIENVDRPYKPVIRLFEANPAMLLLAPLLIDTKFVTSGVYTLSCFPLNVEGTSGMHCRPVLIKEIKQVTV